MRFKFLPKSKISQFPQNLGVYAFKDSRQFLYIGKATDIAERVKNHFRQPAQRNGFFIKKVKKIGWILTNSEIEALILEANLIKKHKPKYNIVWRDNKSFFYVGITKADFPRVFIAHQPKIEAERTKYEKRKKKIFRSSNFRPQTSYVGPFVDGKALKQTLKFLRKVFPYRSCKTLAKKSCLWYQLDRCPAPCLLKSNLGKEIPSAFFQIRAECQRNTKNILKIFRGKKTQVLKDLKKEMKKLAKLENFKKAAKIRDQIEALEKIMSHAKIFELFRIKEVSYSEIEQYLKNLLGTKKKIKRIEAYDVSNIQGQEASGSMVTFINGKPDKNFYRRFKIKISGKPNDVAMIKEILSRRFRHQEWPLPDLILIDGGIAQFSVALKIKNQEAKNKKRIKVISLAKKENKLFIENRKKVILLKNLKREIFNLILQLRDEAHRFAIKYHKKLRHKALIN